MELALLCGARVILSIQDKTQSQSLLFCSECDINTLIMEVYANPCTEHYNTSHVFCFVFP
jgi:hypothetical protein